MRVQEGLWKILDVDLRFGPEHADLSVVAPKGVVADFDREAVLLGQGLDGSFDLVDDFAVGSSGHVQQTVHTRLDGETPLQSEKRPPHQSWLPDPDIP